MVANVLVTEYGKESVTFQTNYEMNGQSAHDICILNASPKSEPSFKTGL